MEDLTYLAEVCFFPECASDHPAAMQRYIGCAGLVQCSFSEENACKTKIEIRACLIPWVQDEWVRRRTMDHDRIMIVVPTSSLVLFTNNYLPRLGHEATLAWDDINRQRQGASSGYEPQNQPVPYGTFGAGTRVDVEPERVGYKSSLVAKWKTMARRKMRKIFPELGPEYTWMATFTHTDSDGEEHETTLYGLPGTAPPPPVDHDEGELESEEGSGTLSQRLPIEEARAMSHKE